MVLKAKVHLFEDDEFASILKPVDLKRKHVGTKVMGTLGPACREVEVLKELLLEGMACARVDLTYAPIAYHRQSLKNLKKAMEATGRICAVVVDTFGRELTVRREQYLNETGWPELRGSFEVPAGGEVILTTDPDAQASATCLPITYKHFASTCQPQDQFFVGRYLANGADTSSLYLQVKEVRGRDVICTAINDAVLEGMLTVIHSQAAVDGMSDWQSNLPLLTEGDIEAIKSLGSEFQIDFLSLTYTGSAQDVLLARQVLDSCGLSYTKIIAKIENRQALLNFDEITEAADAVILSRGNIGLDVAPWKMAEVQKIAIRHCNQSGKPVIITRIVDTMVTTPRCTRAEATDVANAVLDGVDGLLLGAETLRGKYPVETVRTVLSICAEAEAVFDHVNHFDSLVDIALQEDLALGGSHLSLPALSNSASGKALPRLSSFGTLPRVTSGGSDIGGGARSRAHMSRVEAMASTAVRAANKLQAKLIIVFANTGRTASLVAKYRPTMPILVLVRPKGASTAGEVLVSQMQLLSGTIPVLGEPTKDVTEDLGNALAEAVQRGLAAVGDRVVALMCGNQGEDLVLQSFNVPEQGRRWSSLPQGSVVDLVAHGLAHS